MNEWEEIFEKAFDFVKNDITKFYDAEKDELTPNESAIVIGVNKLPMPVQIMDIEVDNEKYPHLKNKISQLILYNIQKIGEKNTRHHGRFKSTKESLYNELKSKFKISEEDAKNISDDLTKKFEYTGFSLSENLYIQFTMYDIRNNLDGFYDDLRTLFYHTFNDYLVKKFKTEKEKDFNALYGLKSDPILSVEEILQGDSRSISLEYLQRVISDIQLIPQVPDPIKDEFQRAKDLFIFSYFRYEFSTISLRSALFAYETAMKMRYVKSLGEKIRISYQDQIVHEFTNVSYSDITQFLNQMKKQKKWDIKNVKVNEQPFPMGTKNIMKWLVANGIPKWKLKMYDAGMHLRNALAHPEKPFLIPPSDGMLRGIAYDINEMFSVELDH